MLWNGLSLDTRSEEKFAWETTNDIKPTQTESSFTLSFQRGNGSEQQLFASSNHSYSAYQTSGGFSAGKPKFQLHGQGWCLHFCTGSFCHKVLVDICWFVMLSLLVHLWNKVKCFGRCGRVLGSPPWITRIPPCSLSSVNFFWSPGPTTCTATFSTLFIWWCTKIDE